MRSPSIRRTSDREVLSPAQQRTPVPTSPGLITTSEHGCSATTIQPLPLKVIDSLLEIEPDHRIVRAVLLSLPLNPKQTQPLSFRICCGQDGQSYRKQDQAGDIPCCGIHDRCFCSRYLELCRLRRGSGPVVSPETYRRILGYDPFESLRPEKIAARVLDDTTLPVIETDNVSP